jgi:asparagine synthase (glutamine-hydrolysing)
VIFLCNFCGYINNKEIIENDSIIMKMTEKVKKDEQNDLNIFVDKKIALGHTRLSIIDLKNENQPMIKDINNNRYVIVYNGKLYNTDDLRTNLISKGYDFVTTCDAEVVLNSFIEFGKKCVNMLNGIFSFAIYDKKNEYIFLARDRLGVKPLFYSISNKNTFVFSSEIKALLEHPEITPIIDKNSLMEIFGLGPAHTPGKTFFKDIFEIEAGFMAIYDKKNGLKKERYWDLATKECNDTEKEAIEQIHYLVTGSTKKQIVSDSKICSMLSGGLDSSILTKIAHDNIPDITTFSIDFKDNDKNFTANSYQMTKDSDYVKIMQKYLNSNHKNIKIDNTDLFSLLEEAVIARDMPGMADIDTSMFAFCKNISKNNFKVCLSGECSDEIFGGYPWYYKEHLISNKGFPWALSENLRVSFVKPIFFKDNELKEYIYSSKENTLKNVEFLNKNDKYENRFRETNYLTIKWFMNTLIERTDRMSKSNSLEVRIPFADYRIFEYVYNLPAKMKLGLYENKIPVEKYLLRKAFENELPEEIVYRKKSPFPKTYDPVYLNLVENKLKEILNNKDSKINNLINTDAIKEMLNVHGENMTENLFGQLMTYPQTLAYLIQINMWLDIYDPKFEI